MALDEQLVNRIREAFEHLPDVEEKRMFSGICFMVNGKMCVCATKDGMLCRIGFQNLEAALSKGGCIQMVMKNKPMKDYVIVTPESIQSRKVFEWWLNLALDFNKEAKASKKKVKP